MSLASTRTDVAGALTAALAAAGVAYKVWPSRPVPLADTQGWLILTLADTEDITYGEIARVSYDVVFSLGSDEQLAEQELDRLAGPLLVAINKVGRGATLRPLTLTIDGTDLYCAAGTLITEVGSL